MIKGLKDRYNEENGSGENILKNLVYLREPEAKKSKNSKNSESEVESENDSESKSVKIYLMKKLKNIWIIPMKI